MQSTLTLPIPEGAFHNVAQGHGYLAAMADEFGIPLEILNLNGAGEPRNALSPYRVRAHKGRFVVAALGLQAGQVLFQYHRAIQAAIQKKNPNCSDGKLEMIMPPPALREDRRLISYHISHLLLFARRKNREQVVREWKAHGRESPFLREIVAKAIYKGMARQLEEIFDDELPEDFFVRPEDVRIVKIFAPHGRSAIGYAAASVEFDSYYRICGEWAVGSGVSKGFGQILFNAK